MTESGQLGVKEWIGNYDIGWVCLDGAYDMNSGLIMLVDYCVCVQLDEPHDVKKAQEQLNKTVSDMQTTLQRIQAPNMRAMEK